MLNKVLLIGRLVTQPQLKKNKKGNVFAISRIAVSRSYKNDEGQREADFINLIIASAIAEHFVELAQKGKLLSVEGEFRNSRYLDQSGQPHYNFSVVCQAFHLLEEQHREDKAMGERVQAITEPLVLAAEDLPF